MNQVALAFDLARERFRELERRLAQGARSFRQVAPGVYHRHFHYTQAIDKLREVAVQEVAAHNADVTAIDSRQSARQLRGEVLAQFPRRARELAR
jgi:hypothetical protein